MASKSRIEWTEATWNPVTGCAKLSPGCKHCYAESLSKRLHAMGTPGYENRFTVVTTLPERLEQPLRRRKPTKYFVNSMSDLFHDRVPDAFIDAVFDVIRRTPHHVYQILTKRAERLPPYFGNRAVPANVWLGVSSFLDGHVQRHRNRALNAIRPESKFDVGLEFVREAFFDQPDAKAAPARFRDRRTIVLHPTQMQSVANILYQMEYGIYG